MVMQSQNSVENLPLFASPNLDIESESKEFDDGELVGPGGYRYRYIGESPPPSRNKARFYIAIIILQGLLNVFLLSRYWYKSSAHTCSPTGSPLNIVYSPVQEAIEYKLVKFAFGLGDDLTPYQGPPSPEVDAAWEALYPNPEVAIPKSEAAKMANKTSPIPGDESNYFVIPEVFHTLHCLNTLRKALHPEYYNFTATELDKLLFRPKHMDHCIDTIRQSLMCSGDVTPLVWAWDEEKNKTLGRTDIVHECRDFSKIQQWAEVHHMQGTFDESVHLENDLDIPIFY
ncbi:hypothetical protein BT96DRAFT_879063 [Gymnopus androsaceus JB14]|uniref:Tat pathway signal sequence n=1 Tax=Gymnopus androsaceus JB14 TaxID=1447944 RepID=A0A6A4HZ24_9AGAR|nr:hypothetical protein BT96DRAFT_879063 [Gymnopus androsaceus JB14]